MPTGPAALQVYDYTKGFQSNRKYLPHLPSSKPGIFFQATIPRQDSSFQSGNYL